MVLASISQEPSESGAVKLCTGAPLVALEVTPVTGAPKLPAAGLFRFGVFRLSMQPGLFAHLARSATIRNERQI